MRRATRCVGGPEHGRLVALPEGKNEFDIAVLSSMSPQTFVINGERDEVLRPTMVTYKLRHISLDGVIDLPVFAPSTQSKRETATRLLAFVVGYEGPL